MAISLTIAGDGMNIERDVTLLQAGRIIAFLGSEAEPLLPATDQSVDLQSASSVVPLPPTQTRQSLSELINNAKAVTNPQKIVVLGSYIASTDPESVFTTKAVKALFPKAHEKTPKNFKRDLLAAVKNGYIEELPSHDDIYFVTNSGKDMLRNGFSATVNRKSKSTKKNSASTSTSITRQRVREEVMAIKVIMPDLEGYPNYHELKTKGAKVMWILAFGAKHSLEHLSPKEVSYIAGKLRDKIVHTDMNGLTITAAKKGWVAKVEGANYTLLHKGHEYLKSLSSDAGINK